MEMVEVQTGNAPIEVEVKNDTSINSKSCWNKTTSYFSACYKGSMSLHEKYKNPFDAVKFFVSNIAQSLLDVGSAIFCGIGFIM